jgi:hypothetical protein
MNSISLFPLASIIADPMVVFLTGLTALCLFGWYLATDIDARKRMLGSVLTVLLVAFCLGVASPPFDTRISSGKEYSDEVFKKLDTNGDGFVDLNEFLANPPTKLDQAKATDKFKKKDTDNDGKLSLFEFKTEIIPGSISLGLDLKGGTSFLLRLVSEPREVVDKDGTKRMETRTITKSMVEQAVGVIDKRVNKFGVSEPIITPQGTDRIMVQIPGLDPAKIHEARIRARASAERQPRQANRRGHRDRADGLQAC